MKNDVFFKTRKFDLLTDVIVTMKFRQQKQIDVPPCIGCHPFQGLQAKELFKAALVFETLIGLSTEVVVLTF